MEALDDNFLTINKTLEENIDFCVHVIDGRLDKLHQKQSELFQAGGPSRLANLQNKTPNHLSSKSFLTFQAPYIRDFRNFSGPINDDIKQIRELTGTEDVTHAIKNKSWSKETKQRLKDAVLDHYAQLHIIELIKQTNLLTKQIQSTSDQELKKDLEQKVNLLEEQKSQVKARKSEKIFVPENPCDSKIDWCAISARLANTHHDAHDCRIMWSNELHWSINSGMWTKDEDECLLNAVNKHGKNDWEYVAKELNSNRLPWQCCARYQNKLASSASAPMNDDDIEKVIEVVNLCRIGNYVPWNQVMYFIQYHSILQVKYQWHKLQSERKSNQSWTLREDKLLLDYVDKYGERDWARISNYIPGRSNKSCRERYIMRLRFEKRAIGNWRRGEDTILLSLIERFGTNWSLIATHLPERNHHQLRSRYELLKNEGGRVGPIRHQKLYREADGSFKVRQRRRPKPTSDIEIDQMLRSILTTYSNVPVSKKSLVCRSGQDEFIYQSLVGVTRQLLFGTRAQPNFLPNIIERAIKAEIGSKHEFFTPCMSTLVGYKAWSLQQDYLGQFEDRSVDVVEACSKTDYDQLLKVAMSLFLWPCILSRLQPPVIDVNNLKVSSLVDKDAKNLYKIREIQKHITHT